MDDHLYRKILRQVHGLAARCVLKLVSDGLKMQAVQVALLAGETADDVERFQNYGFTSVPLAGAEGVCLFLGGAREHGVVVAMDDRRYRIKGLEGGEVAIYTDEGASVILKRGKLIEATCDVFRVLADSRVELLAPVIAMGAAGGGATSASISGALAATGVISSAADVVAAGVSGARHPHHGDSGELTSAPIAEG